MRRLCVVTSRYKVVEGRCRIHDPHATMLHLLGEDHKRLTDRWGGRAEVRPELNADEYLNNDLKGSINAEGLPGNKEDLRSRMERFMNQLLHLPKCVRDYFLHPYVQYAAGT